MVKRVTSHETALSQAKKVVNEAASVVVEEVDSVATLMVAGENATSAVAKVILPGMTFCESNRSTC